MRTYIHLENQNSVELPKEYQEDDFRFSDSLVEFFLNTFTKEGDIVFDPFAGFGTTLIVVEQMRRVPYGIEYVEEYVHYIKSKLEKSDHIIHGDSLKLSSYEIPNIDFSLTSPPYMTAYGCSNPFTSIQQLVMAIRDI
jgi:DNA modification methylase